MGMPTTDDEDITVPLLPRKRKSSNRRSSILKLRPSPTRHALSDIDQNMLQENTETKTKRRRHSRRVSFAETYQVKEFVKEASWNQWPHASDSQDPENNTRETEESSTHGTTITGLEHLLRAPIQMEIPSTQTELSAQGSAVEITQGNLSLANETADTATLLQVFSSVNNSVSVQHKHYTCEYGDYQGVYNVTNKADFNTLVNTSINSYIGSATTVATTTALPHQCQPMVGHLCQQRDVCVEPREPAFGDRTQVFNADMDFTQCFNTSELQDDVFVSPKIKTIDSKNFLSRLMGGTSAITTTVTSPGFGDTTQHLDTDMEFTQCLNTNTQAFLSRFSTWTSNTGLQSGKQPNTAGSGDGDQTIYFDANKTSSGDDIEFTACLNVPVHVTKGAAINAVKETMKKPVGDHTVVFGDAVDDSMTDMDLTGVVDVTAKKLVCSKVNGATTTVDRAVSAVVTESVADLTVTSVAGKEGIAAKADTTVYGGEEGFTSRMDLTACVGALQTRLTATNISGGSCTTRRQHLEAIGPSTSSLMSVASGRRKHERDGRMHAGDHAVVLDDAVNDSVADMDLTGVIDVSVVANKLMSSKVNGASVTGDGVVNTTVTEGIADLSVTSVVGEGGIPSSYSLKADTTVYSGEEGFTSNMDLTTCVGALQTRLTATAITEASSATRRQHLEFIGMSASSETFVSAAGGGRKQERDGRMHAGDHTVVFGGTVNDSVADMDLTGVIDVDATASKPTSSKVNGATMTGDRAVSAVVTEDVADLSVTSVAGKEGILRSCPLKADTTVYGGEEGFTSRMDLTTCVGALQARLTSTGQPESSSNTGHVETSRYRLASQNTLPSASDRVVSVAVTEVVADLNVTSVTEERSVPRSRPLEADTTVYGGEEGFTSRMDLTTCVGALQGRLSTTGPDMFSNTITRNLGVVNANVLPGSEADRETRLCHTPGGHTIVFGDSASDSTAAMELTGVGNVTSISKSHSHKADATVYCGEDGFTSSMDLTTCVGALQARLIATGRPESSSSTSHLEVSRHTLTSQATLPSVSDRMASVAVTEGVADLSVTSVAGEGGIPRSRSLKADTTVYGGEEGFTSKMDLTTCVGALQARLTATADESIAAVGLTGVTNIRSVPRCRPLEADTTVYGGEEGITSRMDLTTGVGALQARLTATVGPAVTCSTMCLLETSGDSTLSTYPVLHNTTPAGNDRGKHAEEGEKQVLLEGRTSESLTNTQLDASVVTDRSTSSKSDCGGSDAGVDSHVTSGSRTSTIGTMLASETRTSHDVICGHTLDTDKMTPGLCETSITRCQAINTDKITPALHNESTTSCQALITNKTTLISKDIASCQSVDADKATDNGSLSSEFKHPTCVGPQKTCTMNPSRSASSSSNEVEMARHSVSSIGIMQEDDLDFLDSPILMSKSMSVMGDTILSQSTMTFNQSRMSLTKQSNSTSTSVLNRSLHARERNVSARHTSGDMSTCSQSIINLSHMSMLSMTALLAGSDAPILPEIEPKTLNDYFQLMGVNLDIKTKLRRSIIPFVSMKPPQSLSDELQLATYPPQTEMYQWACDCMTAQTSRCKAQCEEMEKHLLSDLPQVLRGYNNPENQRTLQNLATESNLRSATMFKEWRTKMVRGTLDRVREEEQELEEAVEELRAVNNQITIQLDSLAQYEHHLSELESKLDGQLSQLDVLRVQMPAVKAELKSAEEKKHLVDTEVTKLTKDKSQLCEDLVSLKTLKATAEKEVEIHQQMVSHKPFEELWDGIQRLHDYSTFRPETWDVDSEALFSALNGSLHLRLQFAERVSCDGQLAGLPTLRISDIELRSRLADGAPTRERLAHGMLLKGVSARGQLTDQCPDTSKLPAFVQSLSVMVTDVDQLQDQLYAIELRHEVLVDTYSCSVEVQFSSRKAHAVFHVTFLLQPDNPTQLTAPCTFRNTIGTVTEANITAVMAAVIPGQWYLQRCVKAVDNFLLQRAVSSSTNIAVTL